MLEKKSFLLNSKKYKQNLKKTKKIFDFFYSDYKNFNIPLLQSYEKNYNLDFSSTTVKKFFKYENIIILGMGGSILGTKSIYSFLKKKIKKKVFFFDNLDQNLYLEFKKIKNLKNSCFIIVSKSGNTLETILNLSGIFSQSLMKNKLIFITEIKNNLLMSIANKFNAEIIEHKDFIGGRYSVLSEVGMLPAELMGLNIKKFKNINKFLKKKSFVNSLIKNVAGIYTLQKKRNNSVILNYDSDLNDLSFWYQQLVAESLGKKGKGISPTLSHMPKDNHSMLQLYLDGPMNKFYTFLSTNSKDVTNKFYKNVIVKNIKFLRNKNLKSVLNAQREATMNVFKSKNIPFRHFVFNKKNEEELVEILTFFVLETILLSRLLKLNAFDQPAVEQVKIETKKNLLR